jgi:hypothetical protein
MIATAGIAIIIAGGNEEIELPGKWLRLISATVFTSSSSCRSQLPKLHETRK